MAGLSPFTAMTNILSLNLLNSVKHLEKTQMFQVTQSKKVLMASFLLKMYSFENVSVIIVTLKRKLNLKWKQIFSTLSRGIASY